MLRELGLVVQVATFCQVSLGGEAAGGVVVAFAVAVPPVVGMPDRNMGGGAWSERAVCAGARGARPSYRAAPTYAQPAACPLIFRSQLVLYAPLSTPPLTSTTP